MNHYLSNLFAKRGNYCEMVKDHYFHSREIDRLIQSPTTFCHKIIMMKLILISISNPYSKFGQVPSIIIITIV